MFEKPFPFIGMLVITSRRDLTDINLMINSIVFSKLFYCSAVWAGTYKQNIHNLKLMQNFAARILTDTGKSDHITPALKALGWLTIKEQLWLRDVTKMYKCVNNLVPAYISCKIGK